MYVRYYKRAGYARMGLGWALSCCGFTALCHEKLPQPAMLSLPLSLIGIHGHTVRGDSHPTAASLVLPHGEEIVARLIVAHLTEGHSPQEWAGRQRKPAPFWGAGRKALLTADLPGETWEWPENSSRKTQFQLPLDTTQNSQRPVKRT